MKTGVYSSMLYNVREMKERSGSSKADLRTGEADASARDLEMEPGLGVLLSSQSRVIVSLLPVQPVDAHVSDGQQDSGTICRQGN